MDPPSTTNSPPVQYELSSEARKTIKWATSAVVPMRGMGSSVQEPVLVNRGELRADHRRVDQPGVDGVDPDSSVSEFECGSLGHSPDGELARHVGEDAGHALQPVIDEVLMIDPPPVVFTKSARPRHRVCP
jgi:hypothetical protein